MPHGLATHPTWMEIDLDALEQNCRALQALLAPGTRIIASVKANAYGHGVVEVTRRLVRAGVDIVATGSLGDAAALREAGLSVEILMFGATLPDGVAELLQHEVVPTVHNRELAEAIARAGRRPARVYVKVDCGHGRLGVPIRQAKAFVLALARRPGVEIEGLYTHLPFSDAAGREWARGRIALFDDLVAALAREGLRIPVTQARASAAILTGLSDGCTAVCPGGLLYGKSPVGAELADASAFRPVLRAVRTRLIHVSADAADRTPGFHGRYAGRVSGATGVVPFGRADGNRAALPGHEARMLVRGRAVPVLGVSLEHAVLDLSDIETPQVGEEVVALGQSGGEAIRIEEVARWQGVTASDVLMTLDRRMPRVLIGTQPAEGAPAGGASPRVPVCAVS